MRRLLIACLVALIAIPVHAAETVLTLTPRPGSSFRVLTDRPARPVGSVILLAGGSGVLDLGDDGRMGGMSQNHVVRTRKAYVRAGYAIFVPDMAGDLRNTSAYRFGAAHATDLAAVVAAARAVGGPVFVIGTSRGSVSVVALFTRQNGPLPDGVVISSGTLMDNGRMRGAASAGDLGRIRVPVLLLPPRKRRLPRLLATRRRSLQGAAHRRPLGRDRHFQRRWAAKREADPAARTTITASSVSEDRVGADGGLDGRER